MISLQKRVGVGINLLNYLKCVFSSNSAASSHVLASGCCSGYPDVQAGQNPRNSAAPWTRRPTCPSPWPRLCSSRDHQAVRSQNVEADRKEAPASASESGNQICSGKSSSCWSSCCWPWPAGLGWYLWRPSWSTLRPSKSTAWVGTRQWRRAGLVRQLRRRRRRRGRRCKDETRSSRYSKWLKIRITRFAQF